MCFKTLLACSLAAAQLLAAPVFATPKSHYVHRGRVVYHLNDGSFCYQGDDLVNWIYTAPGKDFVQGDDSFAYLPRGGKCSRDSSKTSCSDRADGVSYRTIVYFGADNNPADGQNPPQD